MGATPNIPAGGLTLRSVALGLVQVLIVCLGAPYAIWVLGSSEITWSFFPISVGFPFVCLVLANLALRRLHPAWALQAAELVTVAVMGLVVTGIPIFMVGFFLAVPTTPHYFASTENQWGTHVLPHLPEWLIPSNEHQAMTFFFEGLPSGEAIPWEALLSAWVMPLFWWMSLIWTLYFVCFCLVVVLRRQWVERERLAFPLMEVPQVLIDDTAGDKGTGLLKNRLLWIGAAVPLSIALWNIAGFFWHFVPAISWQYPVQIARGFPSINVILYFPVIGFTYFANLSVSFSIWFFYLLTVLQEGLMARFGLGITDAAGDVFVGAGFPTTSWQCWGAFVVMVLWGLWMARDHLRDVVKKAWNPNHPVDDSKELMSYRAAALGILLGLAYILAWLGRAGLPLHVAALFVGGIILAYLGITRLVVQAGVYYVTTPILSQAMTGATLGTAAATAPGLTAMGLCFSFFGDVQSIFMPAAAHAAKLHDRLGVGRGLGLAIALAVVVGFCASLSYIVYMAYEQGAANFNSWFYRASSGAGVRAFDIIASTIKNTSGPHWEKLGFFGIGATAMSVLTFLQYRFPWWPLHPIGLSIASVWMIRNQAIAIFIAWAAKSMIMRFGGIELYRKSAPFFIGLILGHFLGIGISFIVDMLFFAGNGHPVLHG
jgi:hypothetical protein